MKSLIQYIYYRLTKFYKNTFGIEDSPGFLIQSCYDWGSQILTSIVCFYILAIETIILQFLGIRMKTSFILITMLPFIFLHINGVKTKFPPHYVYHNESSVLYYYTPTQNSIYIRKVKSYKDLYRNLGF